MASASLGAVRLVDKSGDALDDDSGRLNVNAYLNATPTIDIGDVSLLLGGTAASTNAGSNTDQTLRVTLAVDDTLTQSVLTLIHANEDDGHTSTDKGIMALGVRNDSLSTTFSGTNGDYTPIAVGSNGAVFVSDQYTTLTPKVAGNVAGTSSHYGVGALAVRNDTLAAYAGIADGDYTFLQVSADGALYVDGSNSTQPISGTVTANLSATDNAVLDAMVVDLAAMEALLITIDSDTDAIKTAVQLIDNAIDGTEMQVDIVSGAPSDGHGAVSHVAQNVTDSAVQLGSNACKHVDIMAAIANTGIVYIGASGVSATTGVGLYAGDVYSVDITNTNLLYTISTVSGDDVNLVIYT